MKLKLMKKLTVFTSIFLLTTVLSAQEVISTQGDSYSNINNTLDFTIGETVIANVTDGTNELTQGFHQSFLVITSLEDLDVSFSVNIFPNPTSEIINLNIEKYEGITFHLFDVAGKLLKEALVTEAKTTVTISNHPKGIYLLTLTQQDNKKIKTYKIIKK